MAFASKYTMTFKDVEDVSYTVYFMTDGWAGAVTTFTPGPKSAVLKWKSSKKHDAIVGCSLEIQAVWQSEIDDLFVEAYHDVRVDVNSTSNHFTGFLMPYQYYRRLSGKPHYATFFITDQLGRLGDYPFKDANGNPYFGITTDLAIMASVLKKAVHTSVLSELLYLRENINIYDTSFDEDPEDSPLNQVYFYPEMYWDEGDEVSEDCYTVLEDILKKYGARIFQSARSWYAQRPQTMWSKHTQRVFADDNPLGYDSNSTDYFQYNRVDSNGIWIGDPEISLLPRTGKATVTADPGRKDNVIKNSTFDTFTQTGGQLRYWAYNGTGQTESDGSIELGNATVGNKSDYISISNFLNGVKTVRFTCELKATWDAGATSFKVFFRFDIWSHYFTTSGWQAGAGDYEYDLYADFHPADTTTDYITFSIDFPTPTGSDYYPWGVNGEAFTVRIYEAESDGGTDTGTLEIRNARLECDYFGAYSPIAMVEYENDEEGEFIEETLRQVDADYNQGSTPEPGNGAIFDGDTQPYLHASNTNRDQTYRWFILGHHALYDTNKGIQTVLARQLVEAAWLPQMTIRGTLRTRGATDYAYHMALVEDLLKDDYGYSKVFVPLDIEWNIHRKEWKGTWVEVSPIYEDLVLDWASETYNTAGIDGNEIDMNETVSGTMGAVSEDFGVVIGEMLRIVVVVTLIGGDLPNYEIDSQTGTLAEGTNYLEFRMSATDGAVTFDINHTNGEEANCVVTFCVYRLEGI